MRAGKDGGVSFTADVAIAPVGLSARPSCHGPECVELATITITEGGGAADTSIGSFTIAMAANAGWTLTSAPSSALATNAGGGTPPRT